MIDVTVGGTILLFHVVTIHSLLLKLDSAMDTRASNWQKSKNFQCIFCEKFNWLTNGFAGKMKKRRISGEIAKKEKCER